MRKTLFDLLNEYRDSEMIPFHMPGHKRNPLYTSLADITEIYNFDDLHYPQAVLSKVMESGKKLWQSDNCFLSVNGSTCGILAGIRSAVHFGDKIVVARNCHKSVYHAIELCGLKPYYMVPPLDEDFGLSCSVTPQMVETALKEAENAALVVVTSPTYEGVVSDIGGIVAVAHKYHVPVLVDQAHGAHFSFSSRFPQCAVKEGADIVVQSLHKTMLSLTQTALCHVGGTMVSPRRILRELNVFETSSPSYILMASIDQCFAVLEESSVSLFSQWESMLDSFSQEMKGLTSLKVLCKGRDTIEKHPDFFDFDPSKIIISTRNAKESAVFLEQELREKYHIETEMTSLNYVVAMTGLGDTSENLSSLGKALLAIDKTLSYQKGEETKGLSLPLPEYRYSALESLAMPVNFVPLTESQGCVSAVYLWAYPPGIPLVVPGEVIEKELIAALSQMAKAGIHLQMSAENTVDTIGVLK